MSHRSETCRVSVLQDRGRGCWIELRARRAYPRNVGGEGGGSEEAPGPGSKEVLPRRRPMLILRDQDSRVMPKNSGQDGGPPAEPVSNAFEQLYLEHAPAAYRLAYVLTGNRDLADDLVQDAFTRVLGRFGSIRRKDSFSAYLRTTLVHLASSRLRRQKLEHSVESPAPGATEPHTGTDVRLDLWQRMLVLPLSQRTALALRYFDDLSEAETAQVMGVTPRAVNALVSRGLASLRKMEE